MFIDTHTHLYTKQFDEDRHQVVQRAMDAGVKKMILPNIDEASIEPMWELVRAFPDVCIPAIGIHPCDVAEDYHKQLELLEHELDKRTYLAIGETGLDLYWDKTSLARQTEAFKWHVEKAKELDLPIIIHARDSFDEIFSVLDSLQDGKLRGVLHCFTGNSEQAKRVVDLGLHLGIGGVITFKKANLPEALCEIDIKSLILETDSPYLAPSPKRGKRNESAYLVHVAHKLAEVKGVSVEVLADQTTQTAIKLFGL